MSLSSTPSMLHEEYLTGICYPHRDIATFQRFYQPILSAIRNPASAFKSANGPSNNPEHLLNRIRNMSGQQMVAIGVVGAEVLGFFTVGEMIGRMKLVGYRGNIHHHETATPH